MSSVVIAGNTSGSVTLAAPDVAGTTTLTLPATSGTVLTDASTTVIPKGTPTFSAYQSSSQSISNATWTKVQYQAEQWDTNSCFDSSTNYRFTPNIAGYYQINAAVYFGDTTNGGLISIYKNGTEFKRGSICKGIAGLGTEAIASALVNFNGTTDYVEIYIYQNTGGTVGIIADSGITYFQASMARAA